MYDDYLLSDSENERIFKEKIVPNNLNLLNPQSVDNPTLVILGGQAGAGKSLSKNNALNELGSNGAVVIDVDSFRSFHTSYDELNAVDDKNAAFHTNADVGKWAEKAQDYVIENKLNVIVEETMRSPERVENTINTYLNEGYTVEVKSLVVKGLQSELSIYNRYEDDKETEGFGRLTPIEVHDAGYNGMPDTIGLIEKNAIVSSLQLDKREGNTVYSNVVVGGSWAKVAMAVETLVNERNADWSQQEIDKHFQTFDKIESQMLERDAPKDELNAFAELRERHEVSLKNNIERNKLRETGELSDSANTEVLGQEATLIYSRLEIAELQTKMNSLFNHTRKNIDVVSKIDNLISDNNTLSLSKEQHQKIKNNVSDDVNRLIESGVEPTEKMVSKLVDREVSKINNSRGNDIER